MAENSRMGVVGAAARCVAVNAACVFIGLAIGFGVVTLALGLPGAGMHERNLSDAPRLCCHYDDAGHAECKPIVYDGPPLTLYELGNWRLGDGWVKHALYFYRVYPENFKKVCSW